MSSHHLSELYNRISKHSHYQVLAKQLRAIVPHDGLTIKSRYEVERLDFILSRYAMAGKVVADIGGNTGFFSLESAAHGASTVLYFDGNGVHAEFVREATHVLNFDKVVEVSAKHFNFREELHRPVDLCFLLNVLHHVGDDYGNSNTLRDEAKKEILESLSCLSRKVQLLMFQLGFNWKGNRHLPLFKHGTKEEMIDFIRNGTADNWDILNIGIAQRKGNGVEYQEVNGTNIRRDDQLGEFLNRPLFIMRSKSVR